jgi:hypothetical protein
LIEEPHVRILAYAMAMVIAVACGAFARADEGCHYLQNDERDQLEWLEQSEPRGVKLVVRDDRWKYGTSLHGAMVLWCDDCATGLAHGLMRFGLAPFMDHERAQKLALKLGIPPAASRLDLSLHPRIIGLGLAVMQGDYFIYDMGSIRAVTDPQPIIFAGRTGFGRVIRAELNGRSWYAVAVAVDEGCFSLFGILAPKDNAEVTVQDVQSIGDAITTQWYTPVGKVPEPKPKPAPTFDRYSADDLWRNLFEQR